MLLYLPILDICTKKDKHNSAWKACQIYHDNFFSPIIYCIPALSQAIMQSQTRTTRYDFLFLLYFC